MKRSARSHPAERSTDPLQDPNRMARSRNSRRQPAFVQPTFTVRRISITVGTFIAGIFIVVVVLSMESSSLSSTRVPIDVHVFHDPTEIPEKIINKIDAILVLGGGVPKSLEEPPVYVQRRLDDAASVVQIRKTIQPTKKKQRTVDPLPILCLSAGTAHLPQLMAADGLPIWESTASAAYLQKRYGLDSVYVETNSYDTIGNAYYARTSHTDIVGWRQLLIVTNEVRGVLLL
jgi:uncharacterized SAM-binding protein YcdF (DUF218 family)